MLEEGIDLPKCNLVVRFDVPLNFCSYIYSKSKACANNANFFIMYEISQKSEIIDDLSKYYEIEQVIEYNNDENGEGIRKLEMVQMIWYFLNQLLLKRCANKIEKEESLQDADKYTQYVAPYVPVEGEDPVAYVNLENAIACINRSVICLPIQYLIILHNILSHDNFCRYCAKLPSDSFTRLTPLWTTNQVMYDNNLCYHSSIRLPINSPYKKVIHVSEIFRMPVN